MSRWRPPPEKSTALITREGHDRLKAELDDLWRVQRPEVVKALAAAAAEGDRSENAEYTYRKKQLAGIDRRVRYLSKRIPALAARKRVSAWAMRATRASAAARSRAETRWAKADGTMQANSNTASNGRDNDGREDIGSGFQKRQAG